MGTKLDKDLMYATAQKLYGAKCPSDIDSVSEEQLASALRKAFAKHGKEHGKTSLAKCDVCGEISPAEGYDACPFCGDASEVEEAVNKSVGDGASEETAMSDGEKKPKPKKAPKKSSKEAKPKAEKKAKAAKAEIIPRPKLTEAQQIRLRESLDASVKNIRDLQRDMLKNGYDIGRELAKVFESQSWKSRGKYKSFKEWCVTEMGFTTAWARQCIAVTKEFDREQYAKIGAAKLAVIKALPAESRGPVVKMAEEGAGLRDLQKKVTSVRERLREQGKTVTRGRKPSQDISAIVKLGGNEKELVLFAAKPDTEGKPVPIDAAEPGCWTFVDLGGGVHLRLVLIVDKKGTVTGLRVKAARKAVDATTAAPAN